MKKIFSLSLLLALLALVVYLIPGVYSQAKTYQRGDAVYYDGELVIASANMGSVEILAERDGHLERKAKIGIQRDQYNKKSNTLELLMRQEEGSLMLYLVDGPYIYRYDISNISSPRLIAKTRHNGWKWFSTVVEWNGRVATIGWRDSIRVWDENLSVVNEYAIKTENPLSLAVSPQATYSVRLGDNQAFIYDHNQRRDIYSFKLKSEKNEYKMPYIDMEAKEIYLADNEALKVFNFRGLLVRQFKHISHVGFAVSAIPGRDYVYFSDGVGVVKIRKSDMKPLDWSFTTDKPVIGGWASGIKVVDAGGRDRLVVFNSSNIAVYDEKLDKFAYHEAREQETAPQESLFLRVDRDAARPGDYVTVTGGGFALNESIYITLAGKRFEAQADSDGRFSRTIEVPMASPKTHDVKADGRASGLTYSTTFQIAPRQ